MTTNHDEHTTAPASSAMPDAPDAFEQAWIDALNRPEPSDPARDAAFTQRVLDRWEYETRKPVLAKIGWTPYAAAAAVLLSAAVGWAVLRGQGGAADPGSQPAPGNPASIAENPGAAEAVDPAPTRIADRSEAERRELARSLQLGTMIAGTSDSLSKPAAGLPKTLDDTANNFSLQGLTRGITGPIPDPNDALPPRRDTPRG